jgi:cellulose biosynthesis protein BcsQ
MSIPVIAFFNNKGGVGKTSLVYHLAWMFADRGQRILATDLDPQANLTASFLREDDQVDLFENPKPGGTIYDCVQPIVRGIGDIQAASVYHASDKLKLIPGDLRLSGFEDRLSASWPGCLDRDEAAFRVTSVFWRIMQETAEREKADIILMDLGPNLGAINRTALIAADFVVVPLAPDLFSLQGLRNLGPTLRDWRVQWTERLLKNPAADLRLPTGRMEPLGYVVLQHTVRLDRPVKAYERWIKRIPEEFHESVLDELSFKGTDVGKDAFCISLLKNYRSLIPLAQEAHKPVFLLRPADGALGGHETAARAAYTDFKTVADGITSRMAAAKKE